MSSAATADAPPPGAEPPLKKAISRRLLIFFIIGDVLGAGIYALVGEVGAETGGAIWTAFMISLALALITAFAYAELVTKYPRAAGAALYVNKAFRVPFLSFMIAFAVMCSGVTSAATLSTSLGEQYLSVFVDVDPVLIGLLFILVVAAINLRGISESVKVNAALTCIEIFGLLLISVIAVAAIAGGADGTDPGRAFEFPAETGVVAAMVGGAGVAFFALIGFEDSVNVAEETENPRRDYPWALFGGLIVAGIIYLIVTILASMAVPTDVLTEEGSPGLRLVAPIGPLGIDERVFSAIALFALANGALLNMIMASRLLYGMSNEGVLPTVFGKVSARTQTPWVAIGFTTALAMILIVVGNLGDLASMTVFLLLIVFTVVNVCVLVLRRDDVGHDHFKAPTAIPVIGAIACLYFAIFETEDIKVQALFLLAVGAILFVVTWFAGGRRELDTTTMEAIERPDRQPPAQ